VRTGQKLRVTSDVAPPRSVQASHHHRGGKARTKGTHHAVPVRTAGAGGSGKRNAALTTSAAKP